MITCIAIDDEPLALDIVQNFCSRIPNLELQKTFTDTSDAARYLRKFPVDLLILDIQMPDISGIEFYKKYGDGKLVVFLTAYSEYAVEGFNVNAIDYLLKPVEFARFQQAMNKASEYLHFLQATQPGENRYLFVRSEYSLVKIPVAEIQYIETLDDYIKIHLENKKPVLTKMNLKNVLEKLNQREFVRVHRSYIIPLSKVISVRNKQIQLKQIEIPIGVKHEKEFFELYSSQ